VLERGNLMPSDLRIQVVVDAGAVAPAMQQVSTEIEAATTKIKAAFGSVAKAPEGIQNALMVLQNASRMSTAAVVEATAAIDQLGKKSVQVSQEEEQLVRSTNNARVAFSGLTREIGLPGNRALGAFISQSQSLGPILNSAFTGIAIAGFIQLAVVAADKISALIADTFIFTDAEKALAEQLANDNKAIAAANEQHAQALRDLAVLGKPLSEAEQMRAQWAKQDAAGLEAQVKAAEAQLKVAQQQLAVEQQKGKQTQVVPTGRGVSRQPVDNSAAIEKEDQAVQSLASTVARLRAQYQLANDAVKEFAGKAGLDSIKEQDKAMDEAARLTQEYARRDEAEFRKMAEERHKAIMGELDDAERAAKEKIRLDSEYARENKTVTDALIRDERTASLAVTHAWEQAWDSITKAQRNEQKKTQQEINADYSHFFEGIMGDATKMVNGLVMGTETVGRAFANLGLGIVSTMEKSFAKALAQELTYMATSGAAQREHALGGIMRDAYKAASNVYAEVPFPFNIPAAAGMFALVAAMGGELPSAAGGMLQVPGDMLAMVHKNESIIPASIAGPMREQLGGGGGSGATVHYSPTIHAIDAQGMEGVLNKHSRVLVKVMHRELRKNHARG
jgi:hypothetical protein